MGEGDITPEVPKTVTGEQKVNTDIKLHSDTRKIEELNDKKTAQAQGDIKGKENIREEIDSLKGASDKKSTESKSEGTSKPEKTISEQLAEEERRFLNSFYGATTEKMMEIQRKAWEKPDGRENRLKALKDINDQIDRLAPKRITEKLDPKLPIEEQKIPDYMLTIDEKGKGTYNPYNRAPVLLEIRTLASKIHEGVLRKPRKEFVEELKDYYTKAKASEQRNQPNIPK